jgi:hypothetical protein
MTFSSTSALHQCAAVTRASTLCSPTNVGQSALQHVQDSRNLAIPDKLLALADRVIE